MSLRINTNTTALMAHRQLQQTDAAQAQSTQRLSSGYRINSAADDPAGLAISENLGAQAEGLGQAVNNANDAINVMKTAEGALGQSAAILRKIRDTALHAANTGANDPVSAAADQAQIQKAIESLDRIASQTAFGSKKLLDGSGALSGTPTDTSGRIISANGAVANSTFKAGYADVNITTAASKARVTGADTVVAGSAVANAGTITINGQAITVAATDTNQDAVDKINAVASKTGVTAQITAGGNLQLDQTTAGSTAKIAYSESSTIFNGGSNAAAAGGDAVATVTQNGVATTFNKGVGNVLKDSAGDTITLKDGATTANLSSAVFFSGSALSFQIGANAGETASASITSAAAANLGDGTVGFVSQIDVTTSAGAQAALKICDAAINQVSTQRAAIGSTQNGIQNTVNALGIAQENISASQSQIRDTDMAAEMVNFTRNNIMSQAGTAMLAQANQSSQNVLSLLRG